MAVRDPLGPPVHGDLLTAAAPPPGAEEILGYRFDRPALLREALTHRSALVGRGRHRKRGGRQLTTASNERLEFIGDRVLGLVIAEWLAERFPEEQEGQLGPRLGYLVSEPVLAGIAGGLGLAEVLAVGEGESGSGVRRRAAVLADAIEALIGAIYLDGGLEPARGFVRRAWEASVANLSAPPKDAKSALQEWLQVRGRDLPSYAVISREGPPHQPVFVVAATACGEQGTGTARTKQEAERLAAAELLTRLRA